jgi:hypothetical protein
MRTHTALNVHKISKGSIGVVVGGVSGCNMQTFVFYPFHPGYTPETSSL